MKISGRGVGNPPQMFRFCGCDRVDRLRRSARQGFPSRTHDLPGVDSPWLEQTPPAPTLGFREKKLTAWHSDRADYSGRAAADGEQDVCPQMLIRRLNRQDMIPRSDGVVKCPFVNRRQFQGQFG